MNIATVGSRSPWTPAVILFSRTSAGRLRRVPSRSPLRVSRSKGEWSWLPSASGNRSEIQRARRIARASLRGQAGRRRRSHDRARAALPRRFSGASICLSAARPQKAEAHQARRDGTHSFTSAFRWPITLGRVRSGCRNGTTSVTATSPQNTISMQRRS